MKNSWLIGLISWFLPGVGHLIQGKWGRGIIIGVVIWAMFIVGIIGGGAYYPGYSLQEGFLLSLLNIFARFGNGLGFLVSMFLTLNPPPNVAAWSTFEYGGKYLEVAGLLNYLAAMDAFDVSFGRKK